MRTTPSSPMVPLEEDDDDDDFADFGAQPSPGGGGGGSNIFSLLNLASSLFPGSSSGQVSVVFFFNLDVLFFLFFCFVCVCFCLDKLNPDGYNTGSFLMKRRRLLISYILLT